MITGAHSIIYSKNPDADRAFLRDMLGLPSVDVGKGWLVFGLPPAEVAIHPSARNDVHEFYLMSDDVHAFVTAMRDRGVTCSPTEDRGWGVLTQLTLPGGGRLGIYEPRHARPKPIRPERTPGPETQLAGFIAKFTPAVATLIRTARKKMRDRLPQAVELVYDNYNFFVIGYGPSEKASHAIFSLAAHAKGVSLCFLHGATLPDPTGLLSGSGRVVRNIRLETAATLDRPAVRTLMKTALAQATPPLGPKGEHRLIIKSVSKKQRPRRPSP